MPAIRHTTEDKQAFATSQGRLAWIVAYKYAFPNIWLPPRFETGMLIPQLP